MKAVFQTSINGLIEEFGNCQNKAGCWHEDADGAEDRDDRESHQTKPVNDQRSKFPIVTHGHIHVLFPEMFGNGAHLIQEFGQLWLYVACWWARTCGKVPSRSSTRDSGGLAALQATDAGVNHGFIGGLGAWGILNELYAGQASTMLLIRVLQTQNTGAPLEQEHAGLWEADIWKKTLIFMENKYAFTRKWWQELLIISSNLQIDPTFMTFQLHLWVNLHKDYVRSAHPINAFQLRVQLRLNEWG